MSFVHPLLPVYVMCIKRDVLNRCLQFFIALSHSLHVCISCQGTTVPLAASPSAMGSLAEGTLCAYCSVREACYIRDGAHGGMGGPCQEFLIDGPARKERLTSGFARLAHKTFLKLLPAGVHYELPLLL